MSIPLPPPPAPYVAPDLRPIAAQYRGTLKITRAANGVIIDRVLEHGFWLGVEQAPLELRFHKREDGTVWAEQAFYVGGERGRGTASESSAAQLMRVDDRKVLALGTARGFVTFTIRTNRGARVASWTTGQCPSFLVRLDRVDSPVDPTFPSTYETCDRPGNSGEQFGRSFVMGRTIGVDRGWAQQLTAELPRSLRRMHTGRYLLEATVNPDGGISESDRSNNTATVPLVVTNITVRRGADPAPPPGTTVSEGPSVSVGTAVAAGAAMRRNDAPPAGLVRRQRADGSVSEYRRNGDTPDHALEADWVHVQLMRMDAAVHYADAVREAGSPRSGDPVPDPPAGVDLPNLRSAPSYGINARAGMLKGKTRDYIDFGALTYNAGPGRLEVEAFREGGTKLDAFQVYYKDGVRQSRQARGTLIWHAAPGHNHFHFQSFARYRLLTMHGKVVRDSGKNSWCIIDTDLVDSTLPGIPNPSIPTEMPASGGCGVESGALWARLSMSVGSGDYYIQSIAGQSFDVTHVHNGLYQIQIEANPDGIIAEGDMSDNVSRRTIAIGGKTGRRTVTARRHPLISNEQQLTEFP